MAAQRKTSTRSKSGATKAKSNGSKSRSSAASATKKARSASSKSTAKTRASSANGSKARSANGTKTRSPKKAAPKKTAAKSKGAESTRESWTPVKEPVSLERRKPARQAAAEATTPSLRPPRGRTPWIVPAMIGILLAGVGIVVILIATSGGGSDNNPGGAAAPEPAAPVVPAPVAPPAAAKPKPKPAAQVQNCDPIFGGGASHDVTSSAKAGAQPASCSEAHSVLLTALNSKAAKVGSWHCVAQPNGKTLASCTSGKQTVVASG